MLLFSSLPGCVGGSVFLFVCLLDVDRPVFSGCTGGSLEACFYAFVSWCGFVFEGRDSAKYQYSILSLGAVKSLAWCGFTLKFAGVSQFRLQEPRMSGRLQYCSVLSVLCAQILHLLPGKTEHVSPPPHSAFLHRFSSPLLSIMKILTSSQEQERSVHRLFYDLSFYSSGDWGGGDENVKLERDRRNVM